MCILTDSITQDAFLVVFDILAVTKFLRFFFRSVIHACRSVFRFSLSMFNVMRLRRAHRIIRYKIPVTGAIGGLRFKNLIVHTGIITFKKPEPTNADNAKTTLSLWLVDF